MDIGTLLILMIKVAPRESLNNNNCTSGPLTIEVSAIALPVAILA
jgi:hypothetical protein